MGKRHLVSQPAPPGAPSSSTNHLFCPSLGGGLAVCRICPPDPTVKEQPGQAADVWHQGHPGAHRRSPALPHMCDPWCLGKAEAREQPFPVCWAVALAGRRTGGRTGGTEKQLSPVRGPPRSDLRCPGSGGRGRAGLTSANLAAEQRGLSPRQPREGVPARLLPPPRECWPVLRFFFFFLPDFSPFLSLFLVSDL